MTLSDLFDLYEKMETRINQYWTYWSVSIIAVSGWMFTDSSDQLGGLSSVLICAALTVFFTANLMVLFKATEIAVLINEEISRKAKESDFLSDKFSEAISKSTIRYRVSLTIALHVAIDLLLIGALIAKGLNLF